MKTLLLLALAASLHGQAIIDGMDASKATITAPFRIGTTDPATCDATKRPFFYNTTSNALKVCNATNTWTVVTGGSATAIADLTDARVTKTDDTHIALSAGVAMCGVTRVAISAIASITLVSGTTGNVSIGVDGDDGCSVVIARGLTLDISGTGFTESAADNFALLPRVKLIAVVPVASGIFGTVAEARTFVNVTAPVFGAGFTETVNVDGLQEIDIDGSIERSYNSLVNAQTGTTYTVLDSDYRKLVTQSNASASAYTLPSAAGTGFDAGWCTNFQNRGAGTATITPTTSTIDGAASLALTTGQGVLVCSDGTNYFTQRGIGGGGGIAPWTRAATVASRGTCNGSVEGQGFVPDDGIGLSSKCFSSTWYDYYQNALITRPNAASNWTVLNGGTLADANGVIALSTTADGLTVAVKSQTDVAWTATLGFLAIQGSTASSAECGLWATDGTTVGTNSASGFVYTVQSDGTLQFHNRFYTPITGAVANNSVTGAGRKTVYTAGGLVWLKVARSGANYTVYVGDGKDGTWTTIGTGAHSLASNIPTHLGFGCDARSGGNAQMKVIHWSVQ